MNRTAIEYLDGMIARLQRLKELVDDADSDLVDELISELKSSDVTEYYLRKLRP